MYKIFKPQQAALIICCNAEYNLIILTKRWLVIISPDERKNDLERSKQLGGCFKYQNILTVEKKRCIIKWFLRCQRKRKIWELFFDTKSAWLNISM